MLHSLLPSSKMARILWDIREKPQVLPAAQDLEGCICCPDLSLHQSLCPSRDSWADCPMARHPHNQDYHNSTNPTKVPFFMLCCKTHHL